MASNQRPAPIQGLHTGHRRNRTNRAGRSGFVHIPRMDSIALIQAKLAERLGAQRYKVWFKNVTQFVEADGHLKISVTNAFIC